jgi:hypothetical protein
VAEYDARIPSSVRSSSGQTVHRESLVIQAEYDAHIPPTSSPGQCRDSIEIQADYDAQIPPRLDRLHAGLFNSQAQYEPQNPPKYSSFSVQFQTAFKRHIPLTFEQKRLTF